MQTLIEAHGLDYQRHGNTILTGVDLILRRREIVTVIGPNGAGKTTLIRLLVGLEQPDSGRIVRRPGLRIGYMPQKFVVDGFLPLTVERFLRLSGADLRQVAAIAARLGIAGLLGQPLRAASGGETQRILLARALMHQPDLLVLDEPTQGVDVGGQTALYQLFGELRDELDCGIVLVSHDLHLVMSTTDAVICLNQHICCEGHPESVSAHPAYLALFGRAEQQILAVYAHHHDHSHDIDDRGESPL